MPAAGNAPIKLGFVGAGKVGQLAHIANYSLIEGCELLALADPKAKLRKQVADRYGFQRTYETHKQLLEDPEIEAVVVVTPRHMTGPIALDCLEAGRHVLTEKPMASTVGQAERLVEAAETRNLRYSVGCMKRYDEGVQRARGILEELRKTGELGPITFARIHCFQGAGWANIDGHVQTSEPLADSLPQWPAAPGWLKEEEVPLYENFLNVYVHNVNLLRFLLGNPSVEQVFFGNAGGRLAVLGFPGHVAVLEAGKMWHRGWDEYLEIFFAKGRLRLELPAPMLRNVPGRIELILGEQDEQIRVSQCDATWAFRRQAEAFIRDIRAGNEPAASGRDAIEDLRLIEEMWRKATERNGA